jgi:hypothetical protein
MNDPRLKYCDECGVPMIECWNLAPLRIDYTSTRRIYADDVYLCDECYDVWAIKYDIQPLRGNS